MRRGGEPFGNLVAVDRQIGKAFIGQAAAQAIDPADGFILPQAARIEIKVSASCTSSRADSGRWLRSIRLR